jgi:hypothetical protein
MVVNPASEYTADDGSLTSFTYTPGASMYYVQIRAISYILLSIIVFANNEEHVKQILLDWVEFKKKALTGHPSNFTTDFRILEPAILEKDSGYTCYITKAPKNQFYKVSWAINDTI